MPKRIPTQSLTIGDQIPLQKLNIIPRKDKEIMLYGLRKLASDVNELELLLIQVQFDPPTRLRLSQIIVNSKRRIQATIWGLAGSDLKEFEEKEEEKKPTP